MIAHARMLLDSNIVIYSVQPAYSDLQRFITAKRPAVSAISYLEVLGFTGLTEPDRQSFLRFFAAARILPIEQPILERAVDLRQQRRMSLGDSIIAATALVHGLTLVTRNTNDFRWIVDLHVVDPIAPPPAP